MRARSLFLQFSSDIKQYIFVTSLFYVVVDLFGKYEYTYYIGKTQKNFRLFLTKLEEVSQTSLTKYSLRNLS